MRRLIRFLKSEPLPTFEEVALTLIAFLLLALMWLAALHLS